MAKEWFHVERSGQTTFKIIWNENYKEQNEEEKGPRVIQRLMYLGEKNAAIV